MKVESSGSIGSYCVHIRCKYTVFFSDFFRCKWHGQSYWPAAGFYGGYSDRMRCLAASDCTSTHATVTLINWSSTMISRAQNLLRKLQTQNNGQLFYDDTMSAHNAGGFVRSSASVITAIRYFSRVDILLEDKNFEDFSMILTISFPNLNFTYSTIFGHKMP